MISDTRAALWRDWILAGGELFDFALVAVLLVQGGPEIRTVHADDIEGWIARGIARAPETAAMCDQIRAARSRGERVLLVVDEETTHVYTVPS